MSKYKRLPIPGFLGYSADTNGNIWSDSFNWRGKGPRIITPVVNKYDYLKVRMMINGKRKNIPIHKLIAITFHGQKPSFYHEVRHLDGNRRNNKLENLKWGTRKENADDRDAHGGTSKGVSHGDSIRAGKANAQLIAAAPDLLIAAKSALEKLEKLIPDWEQTELREAIKKAEGKE